VIRRQVDRPLNGATPFADLRKRAAGRYGRGQRSALAHVRAAEADRHQALLALVALGYGTGIVPDLVLQHRGHQRSAAAGRHRVAGGCVAAPSDLGREGLLSSIWNP
jgi:hypothetical protein